MSLDSAFWVWNLVGNMAYGERAEEAYSLIVDEINVYQGRFFKETADLDQKAANTYKTDPKAAIEMITHYSVSTGDRMTKDWLHFWMQLFSRFRDGFTVIPSTSKLCDPTKHERRNCTSRAIPHTQSSGYNKEWYERIVADSDNEEHYHVPTSEYEDPERLHLNQRKKLRMNKQRN
jgi:hypothetical protein